MASRGYLSRQSRKANSSSHKSKGQRKKKQLPWDSSITNLLVHKPTKEELKRRHELHQPMQRLPVSPSSIECEPNSSAPRSRVEIFRTPERMLDTRYSVLKDIMNTNEKLQKALTYSDKKISAVPDLFGDDPKKYRGFPNITCAPIHKQLESESETVGKAAFMKEPSLGASNLDMLSKTVMDGTALNDLSGMQNADENNEERTLPGVQSKHFVSTTPTIQNPCSPSYGISTLVNGTPEVQKESTAESCDEQAENNTNCEQNMFDSREESESTKSGVESTTAAPSRTAPPALKGLYDLRRMLNNLKAEMKMFEQETDGEQTSFITTEKESFGDFTVSILHAITKLVVYLRDCESRRKTDLILKDDMCVTLQQQQVLIDALTHEIICLQDENKIFREEVQALRETMEKQLNCFKQPEQASGKRDDSTKTYPAADCGNVQAPTIYQQNQTTNPSSDDTLGPCDINGEVTRLVDPVPHNNEQTKTEAAENSYSKHHPLPSDGVEVAISDSPNSYLSTPAGFTYDNPVSTSISEKIKSLTSPASYGMDQYTPQDSKEASVFIGRNQTMSPHRQRRGRQGTEHIHSVTSWTDDNNPGTDGPRTSHSSISPPISPVLFGRQLVPSERFSQERVVRRLPPCMWRDSDTGG